MTIYNKDLLPKIRGKYRLDYTLAPLTWFKVGGKADVFFKPEDLDDLIYFLQNKPKNMNITIIGAGSNTIIRDGGIEGAVIRLGQNFSQIKLVENDKIEVGAGCLNYNLARFAEQNNIQNMEFLIGIPGVIGGGIAMNAGAYGSEFKDLILSVEAVDYSGKLLSFSNDEIGFKYRSNNLPKEIIFTKAILRASAGKAEEITNKMQKISQARSETQPINEKTGGSSFANPEDDPKQRKAWQLIDYAGLRGYRIGGAKMSEKHCNFMINDDNATAYDMERLGDFVRQEVKEKTGINLKWEIKRIGRK